MNDSKAYVLQARDGRPVKKRRVEVNDQKSTNQRLNIYQRAWENEEQRLDSLVQCFYTGTIDQVTSFIYRERVFKDCSHIPTALVVSGPGGSTQGYVFEGLRDTLLSKSDTIYVSLVASDAPNLKTLLRTIIKKATSANDDIDDEDLIISTQSRGLRLLNYDLQILHDFSKARNVQRIVLSLRDFEAFDATVLSDVLQLLVLWLDRLPLTCVLGVATSVDNLNDRLPQVLVKCCLGEAFEVVDSKDVVESVFRRGNDAEAILRIGPNLTETIMQKQRDQGQNVHALIKTFQYCYMSHFFGNSLSILLSTTPSLDNSNVEVAQSIRHLLSFRRYVGDLVSEGNVAGARRLLDSDEALFTKVRMQLNDGKREIARTLSAIKIFEELSRCLNLNQTIPFSTLYHKAFSGEMRQSALLQELLLYVRRASSDNLARMLPLVVKELATLPISKDSTSLHEFSGMIDDLQSLIGTARGADVLRSEHDLKHETYRTTVVAHRVELSRQKSQLSKFDTAYSKLISRFHDRLTSLFSESLGGLCEMFLNEILFYDLRSPYRDTFAPRPRAAIERALSKPRDYLGCSCCDSGQGSLSPSQPTTAILFQLYRESGALINSFDLWNAFRTIVGDRYDDDHITMALYYRGLAELKRAGFIKPSRKKADHFAKVAWVGV